MIYGVFYCPQKSEAFRNFWVVFRNCELGWAYLVRVMAGCSRPQAALRHRQKTAKRSRSNVLGNQRRFRTDGSYSRCHPPVQASSMDGIPVADVDLGIVALRLYEPSGERATEQGNGFCRTLERNVSES